MEKTYKRIFHWYCLDCPNLKRSIHSISKEGLTFTCERYEICGRTAKVVENDIYQKLGLSENSREKHGL